MSKVLDIIKEKIVTQLENGKIPWRRTYNSQGVQEYKELSYSHAKGTF